MKPLKCQLSAGTSTPVRPKFFHEKADPSGQVLTQGYAADAASTQRPGSTIGIAKVNKGE